MNPRTQTIERIRRKYLYELKLNTVEDARAVIVRLYPTLAPAFFTQLALEHHERIKRDQEKVQDT